MPITQNFSENYEESRKKFMTAFSPYGQIKSVKHESKGPNGEDLFIDFGIAGDPDAKGALVLVSGTHGPELFCGSGIQTSFLETGLIKDFLDLKIIIVHALNPYGGAWCRRTDHENIDVNRNFVSFETEIPCHPGYNEIRDIIVPKKWDTNEVQNKLAAYEKEKGKLNLLAAMITGQGHDPDGLFFRGKDKCWSRKTLEIVLPELLEKQEVVSLVDFHTGLGPYGEPYMVHGYHVDTDEFNIFKKAYDGEIRSTQDPDDIDMDMPASPEGPLVIGMDYVLPNKKTYAAVAEYGTVPPDQVFIALMEDNWAHAYNNLSDGLDSPIKKKMREVFYPLKDDWKIKVWEKAQWVIACSAAIARQNLDAR